MQNNAVKWVIQPRREEICVISLMKEKTIVKCLFWHVLGAATTTKILIDNSVCVHISTIPLGDGMNMIVMILIGDVLVEAVVQEEMITGTIRENPTIISDQTMNEEEKALLEIQLRLVTIIAPTPLLITHHVIVIIIVVMTNKKHPLRLPHLVHTIINTCRNDKKKIYQYPYILELLFNINLF